MICELPDRALIAVTGPEARTFLQSLVTNDIEAVSPDRPVYAALLTPQGKILFDFFVIAHEAGLLLDCPRPTREVLAKRLLLYRLRAKVEIAPYDELVVLASTETGGGGVPDPRVPALGQRKLARRGENIGDASPYLAHRLALGVPEGADFGDGTMFALDAGLDELHALCFTKGCYVGQELTARMKHRGKDRKRLLPVEAEALSVGEPVTCGGTAIGTVTSSYGTRGFALTRIDLIDMAQGVAVNAKPAKIALPAWLSS